MAPPPALQQAQQAQQQQQQQQQPQQQPPPPPQQQQQQQQPQPQQQALRKSEAASHWRSGMEGAEVARGAQPCPAPASTPARTAARAGVAPSGGAADPRGASLTSAEVLPPPAGLVRGLYPLRPGRPNCSYYLSTGDCAFKQRCVYNHPEQLPLSRADSAERWTSRAQPAAAAAAGGDAASAAAGGDAPAAAPATSGSPGTEASTAGAALFGASSLAGAGASGGGAAAAGAPQVPPAPNGPAPAAAQQAARPCVTFMLRGVCAQGAACPFEHPARDARRSPSAAVSAAAVWQPPASPQATSGLAQLPSAHAVVAQPAEPPAAPAAPPAAAGATPAAVRTSPPGFGAANSAQAQAPADTGTLQPQAGAAGALGGASASSSAAAAPAPAATQQPAAAAAAPAQAPAATSAVQQPAAAPAGDAPCTSSAARAHQAHPVACHNSDGLPMRLHGAINCPFYMHTGQCRYGRSCRFHHPEAPALPAAYVESGGTYMAPRWKGPVSYARLLNHLERLWDADFCPAAQLKLLLARHMLAAANPGCSMWSPSAAQHVSTEPHRYRIAVQQAGELLLRLWAAQPDADAAAQPMPYRGRGSGGAGLQALLADDPYFQTAADEGRSHHYWVLLQLPKIVQLLNW